MKPGSLALTAALSTVLAVWAVKLTLKPDPAAVFKQATLSRPVVSQKGTLRAELVLELREACAPPLGTGLFYVRFRYGNRERLLPEGIIVESVAGAGGDQHVAYDIDLNLMVPPLPPGPYNLVFAGPFSCQGEFWPQRIESPPMPLTIQ